MSEPTTNNPTTTPVGNDQNITKQQLSGDIGMSSV